MLHKTIDITKFVDETLDYIIDRVGESANPEATVDIIDYWVSDFVYSRKTDWNIHNDWILDKITDKAISLYIGL